MPTMAWSTGTNRLGIASAAFIGGAAISAGWAYGQLPLLSCMAFGCGLLGTLALVTLHRPRVPVPAQ